MDPTIDGFLDNFNKNEPVRNDVLAKSEREFGVSFPGSYREFLSLTNGGEGFIGQCSYVIFWKLEELVQMNSAYQVDEYAPGLLLFGSNGGGEAYAFDLTAEGLPIVEVPFVGMDRTHAHALANDFLGLLSDLYDAE